MASIASSVLWTLVMLLITKLSEKREKPYFYIETLMQHLKREYYVALLSAVEVHLSPKEALQANEITVITSLPPLRDSFRGQSKIRYLVKKDIKDLREIGVKRKTLPFSIEERTLRVASLELTAVDLLLYEKEIGGIQKAVEVIQGLKPPELARASYRGNPLYTCLYFPALGLCSFFYQGGRTGRGAQRESS